MQKSSDSLTTKSVKAGKIPAPLILDIRPIFSAGASPCGTIDQAVASLKPEQPLVLVAPFEPIPLFTKLAAQGFEHQSEAQDDGSWRIVFKRSATPSGKVQQSCCCSEEA